MPISRRSFLKLLGVGAAAAVTAPVLGAGAVRPGGLVLPPPQAALFIPSEHLDAVPTQRLSLSTNIEQAVRYAQQHPEPRPIGTGSIPMLLIQSEFMLPYGKLPAGSEVMVDDIVANRWVRNNIAVPGPSAPPELQLRSAQRRFERKQEQRRDLSSVIDWSVLV